MLQFTKYFHIKNLPLRVGLHLKAEQVRVKTRLPLSSMAGRALLLFSFVITVTVTCVHLYNINVKLSNTFKKFLLAKIYIIFIKSVRFERIIYFSYGIVETYASV